jgi:hypothetical protein
MRLVIAQQCVRILTKIDPLNIQTHSILFLACRGHLGRLDQRIDGGWLGYAPSAFQVASARVPLDPCLGDAYGLWPLEFEAQGTYQQPLEGPQMLWSFVHSARRLACLQAIRRQRPGGLPHVPLHRVQSVAAVGYVGHAQVLAGR